MNFLLGLLPTFCVLGVLIFIHELGHFIACKCVRVRVEKFSIGFGPELFHFQGKETRYILAWIPFGGYVKPSGESYEDLGQREPQPSDFLAKGVGRRSLIVAAGVLMNYLLAVVLFSLVFFFGRPVLGTRVGGFVEGYPAQTSGFDLGDRITKVEGQPVLTWNEVTEKILDSPGIEVTVTIEREGVSKTLKVIPKEERVTDIFGNQERVGRIGVKPSEEFVIERYGFLESWVRGAKTTFDFTLLTFKALWSLVTGRLSLKALSGPIGIFVIASETAQLGFSHLVQLTAFLNVSLAVFNLLPFPPLDGGLLLFLVIEAVTRRRVSLKFQEWSSRTGYFLLILLMVVVMYNDLSNLQVFEKLTAVFQR
jgi:regulator of sigma E protease